MAEDKKSPFTAMGAMYVLAGGLTVSSVAGLFFMPDNPIFKIMLISVVAMAAALGLYKLVLVLRDKGKSGPFAKLLTKSSSGGAMDPATKARMDDLRRKFEEGVAVYKSAGKDLYTLPWYMLVGPSGSGKTEAVRHSNIGFPQGLQDCLQGAGGTLNMHWWFSNSAVVLDTAGRLFMQEDDREWKEFMRLLKLSRPNCPVNGLLLVISSENLLKDSAEKIEATAGAIARKLDEMQRILDVRFPVSVIVTKCDKIIGFREFFETLSDPILQHQMLGWSNPSPLDEAFKPDMVEKHLDTVRQKLLKRRMGLIQNPVHTSDASARRIDQVDEMFEFPDNLVRISPRLRLYLEKIFVAGEWSPKPLFLRGIYFTSSMREGQALDMSLAQALGVEVESLPGSRDWDRDKSYFLKDLFLEKVFKERGLVTRATNVGKQLVRQRLAVVGVVSVMLAITVAVGAVSYFGYQKSLGEPTAFWTRVPALHDALGGSSPDKPAMPFIVMKDGAPTYGGRAKLEGDDIPEDFTSPADVLEQTTAMTKKIEVPAMAKPIASFSNASGGFEDAQIAAQRAVVEVNVLRPVVDAARAKLAQEKNWNASAVGALKELVRLQTYSLGAKPSDASVLAEIEKSGKPSKDKGDSARAPIDIDALYRYVLAGDEAALKDYTADKDIIGAAVARAYGGDYWGQHPPEQAWAADDNLEKRVREMAQVLYDFKADPTSNFGRLQTLTAALLEFQSKENALLGTAFVSDTGAGTASGAANPRTISDYDRFEKEWTQRFAELGGHYTAVNDQLQALKDAANDPIKLASEEGDKLEEQTRRAFVLLLDQLPAKAADEKEADKNKKPEAEPIANLRETILARQAEVSEQVKKSRTDLDGKLASVKPFLVMGTEADQSRVAAFRARYETYDAANKFVTQAGALPESTEYVTIEDRMAQVDKVRDTARERVNAHSSWKPDRISLEALKLGDGVETNARPHDRAMRGADKVVTLARARLVHAHLSQYIAVNPASLKAARERVAAVARAGIDAKLMEKFIQPNLPLSGLKDGEEFSSEYHPQAAAKWLGGWDRVRSMLDAKASEQVLGVEVLTGERYRSAEDAVKLYISDYCEYWRNQATEVGMPSQLPREWAAMTNALPGGSSEVNGALRRLRDMVLGTPGGGAGGIGAMQAIPSELQKVQGYTEANRAVMKAFEGLANDKFDERSRLTLKAWRTLAASPTPRAAADSLLAVFKNQAGGKNGCDQYYQVSQAERVLYWDEFTRGCTSALATATSGDVGQALMRLGGTRKSPLYKAGAGTGPAADVVSSAQLQPLAADARIVAQAAISSGGSDFDFSCADAEIAGSLQAMTGQGAIKDKAQQDWARRVGELCVALSSPNVKIVFTNDVTLTGNRGENVRTTANYMRVVDKGQPRDGIGNEKLTEEMISTRTTLVPGGTYTIQFYNIVNNGEEQKASFELNTAWPMLHEMLTSGEAIAEGDWGKAGWIEFPLKNGGQKAWIRMQIRTEKGPINFESWPDSKEWP